MRIFVFLILHCNVYLLTINAQVHPYLLDPRLHYMQPNEIRTIGNVQYKNYGTLAKPKVVAIDARGSVTVIQDFLTTNVALPIREIGLNSETQGYSDPKIVQERFIEDYKLRQEQNKITLDPLRLRAYMESVKPVPVGRYVAEFFDVGSLYQDVFKPNRNDPYKKRIESAEISYDKEKERSIYQTAKELHKTCNGNIDCIKKHIGSIDVSSFPSKQAYDEYKKAISESLEVADREKRSKAEEDEARTTAIMIGRFYGVEQGLTKLSKEVKANKDKIVELSQSVSNTENISKETQSLVSKNIELTSLAIEIGKSNLNVSQQINEKLDFTNDGINEVLKHQFLDSPLDRKLQILTDEKSRIYKLLSEEERAEKIEMVKNAIFREKTLKALNHVQNYGAAAQEALSIFCDDCPEIITESIKLGTTAANILGNVMTQNYSAAIMSALGLFKKQQPSPEFQMLQQIQSHLIQFEKNMGKQFEGVHKHLNIMEENLGEKLDIMNENIEIIYEDMHTIRNEMLAELSNIDAKLDFIMLQNQCTQDILVKLGRNNVNSCDYIAAKWKEEVDKEAIKTLEDIKSFYQAYNCQDCINAMLNISGKALTDDIIFRFTSCDKQNTRVNLESMYDFLYTEILERTKNFKKDIKLESILYIPKSVENHPTHTLALRNKLVNSDGIPLMLVNADGIFRNYRNVLNYCDNYLSLIIILELYNSQYVGTMTLGELSTNQSFSMKRLNLLKDGLKDIILLLDHTKMQQSLMAGVGIFEEMQSTITQFINMDHKDRFKKMMSENMNLNKNYTAYIGHTLLKKDRIKSLNNSLKQNEKRKFKIGDQKIEVEKKGMHLLMNYYGDQANTESIFTGSLAYGDNDFFDEMYEYNISFSVPSSIKELEDMKDRVLNKLYELEIVTNPELDNPSSKFTRDDLYNIIALNSRN